MKKMKANPIERIYYSNVEKGIRTILRDLVDFYFYFDRNDLSILGTNPAHEKIEVHNCLQYRLHAIHYNAFSFYTYFNELLSSFDELAVSVSPEERSAAKNNLMILFENTVFSIVSGVDYLASLALQRNIEPSC